MVKVGAVKNAARLAVYVLTMMSTKKSKPSRSTRSGPSDQS